MKEYVLKVPFDKIFISEFDDGTYTVHALRDRRVVIDEFKKIGKKPPNEYGNFFGRKKAGAVACRMLIEKYGLKPVFSTRRSDV